MLIYSQIYSQIKVSPNLLSNLLSNLRSGFSSQSLYLVFFCLISFSYIGCGESEITCDPHLDRCTTECLDNDPECNQIPTAIAHQPDCIATKGALCIQDFSWEDHQARYSVLTPGESVTLHSFTLRHEGDQPLSLDGLSLDTDTSGIHLTQGGVSILSPEGTTLEVRSRDGNIDHQNQHYAHCEDGVIPPQSTCRFDLNLDLNIIDEAPVNQIQLLGLTLTDSQNQEFQFTLPLLIVNPNEGLVFEEIVFDDESRDQKVQAHDHIRFTHVKMRNQSFATFQNLSAHLAPHPDDAHLIELGEGSQMWSDLDRGIEGFESIGRVDCQATSFEQESPLCTLDFDASFYVKPEVDEGQVIRFEVRFKAEDDRVDQKLGFDVLVESSQVELDQARFILSEDQNRDQFVSPGESVRFLNFEISHQSGPAVSLRGRVRTESPWVSIREQSNLSIQITNMTEFYAACGDPMAGVESQCRSSLNLRIDVDSETPIGQEILFNIELMDQFGHMYDFEWVLVVNQPAVALELEEIRISQDTFDSVLSAGEMGIISYIKFKNYGLADALDVQVSIQSESPWISFHTQQEFEFPLINSDQDQEPQACLSVIHKEDAYCYHRLDLRFDVVDDAPLGAEILLLFHVQSGFGLIQTFSYTFTLD
jgi:hypothetical protein